MIVKAWEKFCQPGTFRRVWRVSPFTEINLLFWFRMLVEKNRDNQRGKREHDLFFGSRSSEDRFLLCAKVSILLNMSVFSVLACSGHERLQVDKWSVRTVSEGSIAFLVTLWATSKACVTCIYTYFWTRRGLCVPVCVEHIKSKMQHHLSKWHFGPLTMSAPSSIYRTNLFCNTISYRESRHARTC